MLTSLTPSGKNLYKVQEKEKYIQDITPITYNVQFKSLEMGEVFDREAIKYYPISNNQTVRKNKEEILFCVYLNGAKDSEYCLNLVNQDFIPLINSKCIKDLLKISSSNVLYSKDRNTSNNELPKANIDKDISNTNESFNQSEDSNNILERNSINNNTNNLPYNHLFNDDYVDSTHYKIKDKKLYESNEQTFYNNENKVKNLNSSNNNLKLINLKDKEPIIKKNSLEVEDNNIDLREENLKYIERNKAFNSNVNRLRDIPSNSDKDLYVLSTKNNTYDINNKKSSFYNNQIKNNINDEKALKIGRVLGIYVHYSSKDKETNYIHNKQNIINKFSEQFGYNKRYGSFYIEDRWSVKHPMQQINNHATQNKADFILTGFNSLKGFKEDRKELDSGINFLLSNSIKPMIVVKENCTRNIDYSKDIYDTSELYNNSNTDADEVLELKSKKNTNNKFNLVSGYLSESYNKYSTKSFVINTSNANKNKETSDKIKGFKWIFILEKNYYNRMRVFEFFNELIDKNNDYVHGFGLHEQSVPSLDPIEKEFTNYCKKEGFKYYGYDSGAYKHAINEVVTEKVNFGNIQFEFVCFFNNRLKQITYNNGQCSADDYSNLIKKVNANICFINLVN